MTPGETDDHVMMQALAAPFGADQVRWKPQIVKDNRALVLCYVDARTVQDRLDDVLGVANWQDDYEFLEAGSVLCRLKVRVGGEWLTKVDVGGPSEQPDGGDRVKAAFSDALKRAAVKFGVGRYLYRLPQFWCDYDPRAKKILKPPQLPAWALPPRQAAAPLGAAKRNDASPVTPEEVAELKALASHVTPPKTRVACMRSLGLADATPWEGLTRAHHQNLKGRLETLLQAAPTPPGVTQQQLHGLDRLVQELQLTPAELEGLLNRYDAAGLGQLTAAQAEEMLGVLDAQLADAAN